MQLLLKKSRINFLRSLPFLGLILVFDQLLLPMFHFNGIPFKISYFLCALWLLDFGLTPKNDASLTKEFNHFALLFLIIISCSLLGELYFSAFWERESYEPLVTGLLFYILIILSFGLGLHTRNFNINWLSWVLYISLFLNFVFIFFKFNLPSWLVDFYYSQAVLDDMSGLGLDGTRGILELARPRGLFPNPNGSALMVNIITLFIFFGQKYYSYKPNKIAIIVISIFPILLSLLLATRSGFLTALVFGYLNLNFYMSNIDVKQKFKLWLMIGLIPLIIGGYILKNIEIEDIEKNVKRAVSVIEVVSNIDNRDSDTRALSSIARPLLTAEDAYLRFQLSPLFGSGYSATEGAPFKDGTTVFHNDWFRILVTSGLIGFFVMIKLVRSYCLVLGWPVIFPFFIPGMTNTFILNLPAVMFYFFMIGLLRRKLKLYIKNE